VQYIWNYSLDKVNFIRPPGTVVPGRPCVLQQFFILFFHREISEVCGPISAKFCHTFGTRKHVKHFQFTNAGPKIWGPAPPKNLGREKCAKIGLISDPFQLWARIFLERTEISKIGKLFDRQHFLPPLTKKVWWTLIY